MLRSTLALMAGASIRHLSLLLIFFSAFMSVLGCVGTDRKIETQNAEGTSWKEDMHKLATSMSKLLPLAVSSSDFHKKKNAEMIKSEMKSLVFAAKRLEKSPHATQGDPVLVFTAQKFAQDLEYAYEQYNLGNSDFAQNHIRNSTRFCMSCHTRNNQGRQFDWSWGVNLSLLSEIDRAQYLASIRDFDRALEVYNGLLSDKNLAETSPQKWSTSAKNSMAIAVRVKQDPKLALEIIQTAQVAGSVPLSVQQMLLQWKSALQEWQSEKKKSAVATPSFKEQLTRANELLQKGWQSTQFPQSGAGAIYYLRASSLLHDLLDQKLSKSERAQALYSSGLVAEKLKDINLWTLHETYYEACVRTAPRTQLAKKCYLRYESVVITDYLVSPYNGLIPVHVRNHLDNLRRIAEMGDWNELLNWGLVE